MIDSDLEVPAAIEDHLVDEKDWYKQYITLDKGDSNDGSTSGDSEDELLDFEALEALKLEKRFNVLNEKEIAQRQEEMISKIASVLLIDNDDACVLLTQNKWDIRGILDAWFSDEERIRIGAGLLLKGADPSKTSKLLTNPIYCVLCCEDVLSDKTSSAGCSHFYCNECWQGYIKSAVGDGVRCLSLRCPETSCNAPVRRGMVNKLATKEDGELYLRIMLLDFVARKRETTKWCQAPGCGRAVEQLFGDEKNVSCSCNFSSCWNCGCEDHRPVNCVTATKWISKDGFQALTDDWLTLNSKPCPRCGIRIVKNKGCHHMQCTACNFHFCWLCLQEYVEHGNYEACQRFDREQREGLYAERDAELERAKQTVEKYERYNDLWTENEEKQKAGLQKVGKEKLSELSEILKVPETKLKFLSEAWLQIVECRRALKWSCVYGYYLEDDSKSDSFEFLHGEAKFYLEQLEDCAELGLSSLLTFCIHEKFQDFKVKLTRLTSTTRSYFQNFVQVLEENLKDFNATGSNAACQSGWQV